MRWTASGPRGPTSLVLGLVLTALAPAPLAAQDPPDSTAAAADAADAQQGAPAPLRVIRPGGELLLLEPRADRGYAAVSASGLEPLGWEARAEDSGAAWRLAHEDGAEVELVPGDPFFRWDGEAQQLVDPPYVDEGELMVPAQLVLDFLPFHLPDTYRVAWKEDAPELHVVEGAGAGAARVVVIDPGHGGQDLGAVGSGGGREKDVALAVGRALARELSGVPGLEVHLTRDSDELIPLWRRGEWATEVKGRRSGVFISLHANAMADRSARGYETYFLSPARTEHERRVAAIENAPLDLDEGAGSDLSDLGFIFRELRKHDHQHWSALLAELVQERLGPVHPGPDRGVKQAPFAVITNALMPAVLVEMGFMSNREDERILGRPGFHDDMAGALAEAVVDFFRRYPPGSGEDPGPVGPPGSRP